MDYKEIYDILDDIREAKNADYGDSFGEGMREFGLISSVVRMSDKMERLKSLCKKQSLVQKETILDTLFDLANYAIMTIHESESGAGVREYAGVKND
jgi:hypothetical protein